MQWYNTLFEVPDDNVATIYIAHEFLDTMPVHLFLRNDALEEKEQWSELLVNVEEDEEGAMQLAFQRSIGGGRTPGVQLLLEVSEPERTCKQSNNRISERRTGEQARERDSMTHAHTKRNVGSQSLSCGALRSVC